MNKKLKAIAVFSIIIRVIGIGYSYYTIFSDINKLSENFQQVNQGVLYEALTQEEVIEAF
jgi:hypothetical protein